MFWITLRQYSEERALARWNHDRDRSLSTNRGSQGRPSFQRHMSLASAVLPQVSPTLLILSNFIRGLFIKYWIWVVAIMLMIMSLGGDRVVIYRIVYMSLFLSFIFFFQVRSFTFNHIEYFLLIEFLIILVVIQVMAQIYVSFLARCNYLFDDCSHRYLYLSISTFCSILARLFENKQRDVS